MIGNGIASGFVGDKAMKFRYVCDECKISAFDGLFKHGDKMICCRCKYGKPMGPWWPVSKLSAREPRDLEYYDGCRR